MSVRSVLEIDVTTAEFDRYRALFDSYTEKLKKQPALWAAIEKQHKQLTAQFRHAADAVGDEHNRLQDLNKVSEANERRLEKSKGLWSDMADSSDSFAKNLNSASGFLSKWGGLLFGGIIGGAAFGIDRAVHDASSNRQQSLGLGTSIGELKAFSANYGRVVDNPEGLLASVNTMETDATKQGPWWFLRQYGLGNMTGDTVKDTMNLLDAERKFAQRTPLNIMGSIADKVGLPSSIDKLRLMGDTKDAEWNTMRPGFAADFSRMDVPGAKSLQDLSTQFGRNMSDVWSAFEKQLVRAAPELSNLSDAASKASISFINSAGNEIASLWRGAHKDPLAPFRPEPGSPADLLMQSFKWGKQAFGSIGTQDASAYRNYLGRRDLVSGLPTGMLEAVFQTESGGLLNPHASAKGALGPFQFMPDTAKQLGINPLDPLQAESGAEKYLSNLMTEFHDLAKTLAAYNWGPGHLEALLKAHPKDWQQYLPKETQDYVRKIEVILQNNTGGSTTVAANQLAH